MAMRGPRLQAGSGPWVAEERSCALQIAQSEVEEFSYSVRNEFDWLNEHMAGIFNENERNIAEAFKTPGKLHGKTPGTTRRVNPLEARAPLSDVFSSTPNGSTNRFAQNLNRVQSPKRQVSILKDSPSPVKSASRTRAVLSPKPTGQGAQSQDSGYGGSQDIVSQPTGLHESFVASQQNEVDDRFDITVASLQADFAQIARSPEKPSHQADAVKATPRAQAAETQHPIEEEEAIGSSSPMALAPDTVQASSSHVVDAPASPTLHDDGIDATAAPQDEIRSPSDGSSPIRPMVRKSSLNFAPLPAREPLAGGKSLGPRASRLSHLDEHRMSYYGRNTGGKSLGNQTRREAEEEDEDGEDDQDEMEVEKHTTSQAIEDKTNPALNHNRTYTQRLQDQINMLGKSTGASRPSKSIPNFASVQAASQAIEAPASPVSKHISPTKSTPGAFPEDDDDWIDPPSAAPAPDTQTRPTLPKSHSADVMEGIHSHDPFTDNEPDIRTQLGPGQGHAKSASVPAIPQTLEDQTLPLTKESTIPRSTRVPSQSPSKSPSKTFRDSPLKQVKNKLSSILKTSSRLLVSSAAASAEGKSAMLSPSHSRLALHAMGSESTLRHFGLESHSNAADAKTKEGQVVPAAPIARRTRASVEKEKEEKRREKETKVMEDQFGKLEKAREKEREKARVFSKEQEKIANMERQVSAQKETAKPTRTSPRRAKEPVEEAAKPADQDVEMTDAPAAAAPPPNTRSAGAARTREIKRPVKPTVQSKTKQAPTVIRVNTGSQNSQFQSSVAGASVSGNESTISATSQSQPGSVNKASKVSLQTKPSTQNLRAPASASKSKTLDLASKRKEQEEAQRKRELKAEAERKRAQEEQRKQEQRRQEAERQRQKEREQAASNAEAKQSAQRQALLEKAKQTRAPPPAVRSQPNGPPDYGAAKTDGASRPPSRMNSGAFRSHEDLGRPVSAVLSNASKAGMKRTLGHDAAGDSQPQRPPSRAGPSYQMKDAKRRRTSQEHDELDSDNQPNIKGPPVRPSAGFKKEPAKKSMFQNGYTNAPPSATRDLFKATVTAQHNSATKATHPLDMAQISKGAIPFAPNPNPAGAFKTPARPGAPGGSKSVAKTAQRSSPRFQNGESIELPEIQTDDESEDEGDAGGMVAPWADSPDLRRALMRQETMDPSQIFGPPAPLNMEEVFNKNKDRWHKFRNRTSSANWSGADRLTEDDIRKDLAARDKLRREGGWSYEMSKDMM